MNDNDLYKVLILNLKRDEGFRSKPYKDTVGKLTIGYGRNLDDVGISEAEADKLLSNDVLKVMSDAAEHIPDLDKKPWQIRLGLYNMVFNMGIHGVLKFSKMLEAIDHDDYKRAADEALNSKWATQVGPRADRIAELFRDA